MYSDMNNSSHCARALNDIRDNAVKENEYRDLLENIKLGQIDGLEIGIAKIFLKLGNLSRSWEILKKSNHY